MEFDSQYDSVSGPLSWTPIWFNSSWENALSANGRNETIKNGISRMIEVNMAVSFRLVSLNAILSGCNEKLPCHMGSLDYPNG
jgi:hypothetical protein